MVGKVQSGIAKGGVVTTANVRHAAKEYKVGISKQDWKQPDVSKFTDRVFLGYLRADVKVGAANYWLVMY